MSVLIGITSRNRFEVLPKALISALSQSFPDIKVSVFDDNSTDRTNELVKDFPMVDWEISKENKGLVYARNKMMQNSSAKYFCSLDDDAWFLSNDEIDLAVKYFESNSRIAAIAFDILSPEFPMSKERSAPYETGNFIGCGHILRLSAVREIGFYEVFPSLYGSEENDLCIKLIDKGYKIIYLPGVHVWHDKINLERDEIQKHESVVCNDLVFVYRRSPFLLLLPSLVFKLLSHLRFSVVYKKGRLFRPFIKGTRKFLGQWFGGKLVRKPVGIESFNLFRKLNRAAK